MSKCYSSVIVLAAVLVLAVPAIGSAQNAAAPPAYRPGLGDLMTMTVQPRHIKLAVAGRERNWSYAAYELHQLEEAFDRVARNWPTWRSVPIAEMMTSLTKEPMAALAEAIKSADASRFGTAFGRLTETCNTCHQGANSGMIVIRVPDNSPFSDQDFRPVQR
ncbi:MAG: cytochrome c [Proteobacteria bacterium]|nr:cytochrome c [Pseudomonadota bacterium]